MVERPRQSDDLVASAFRPEVSAGLFRRPEATIEIRLKPEATHSEAG